MIAFASSPRLHGGIRIEVDYTSGDGTTALDDDVLNTASRIGTLLEELAVGLVDDATAV